MTSAAERLSALANLLTGTATVPYAQVSAHTHAVSFVYESQAADATNVYLTAVVIPAADIYVAI